MKIKQMNSVDFAIRTLPATERSKVSAWFDHLANWENDQLVRNSSKPSSIYKDVYVLTTADDLRITFSLDADQDEITVLDLTKPSMFKTSSHSLE